MHPVEKLYSDAMEIARQELSAMENEDMDLLDELCLKRRQILEKAWCQREGCAPEFLIKKISEQHEMQNKLKDKAESMSNDIRRQLKTRNKQSGYFNNARSQSAMVGKSYYINKVS